MDPLLTSGSTIATIGISTVFFALVTLIIVVGVASRLLSPLKASPEPGATQPVPETKPAAETADEATDETAEQPEPQVVGPEIDFQQIALSAYAYHRRATTRVKSLEPSTSWEALGRMRELTRRNNRN